LGIKALLLFVVVVVHYGFESRQIM
jgi:hypothetical protein